MPPPATGTATGRLRSLFEAALAQPAPARDAWLSDNIAGDDERIALRRLLAADAMAGGALDIPVTARAADIGEAGDGHADEVRADSLVGQRIGPFRLLRVLGQGGMATVFLARREDADFDQEVAVKLLRRGLYSEVEQRLFRRERRALAALSHPNIAHLLDGGITDAGIPYLVMEHVDGLPITRHAADRQLDLRARLRLFAVACHAVAAAHRALIVHRDIKPSNLLVTPGGEPKLLDFGIAKLLDDDDGATRSGLAALTPDYAAPEQLAGGPISTATDVYALGVLLHELLLGARPQRADPGRPSTRVVDPASTGSGLPASRAALRTALRGDLDNILLKALAAEPDRRYDSAAALAADIERHLQAQPVSAHPPSNWYRTRKFVQRHRGGVVVTALFASALLASLGLTAWQADVARREAARANTVRAFVQSLFDPVRDGLAEGQLPNIRDLVRDGVARLDATPGLGAAERVDLMTMFASLHADIGELPRAGALAEAATVLAGRELEPMDPPAIRALATRGEIATLSERYPQAEADLREAQRRMRVAGLHGEPRVRLLDALASVENSRGQVDAVLRLAQRALAERHATWGADSKQMGEGFENLGFALEGAARYDEAARAWHRAWQVNRRFTGPDSLRIANAMQGEASSLWRAGRWREARPLFERANAMLARIAIHPKMLHLVSAGKLCQLVGGLAERGAAERDCANALDISRRAYSTAHPAYADTQVSTALGLVETGDLAAARKLLLEARGKYADDVHDALRRGRIDSELAGIALREHDPARARQLLAGAAGNLRSRAYWMLPLIADARLLLACAQSPSPECPGGLEARVRAESARHAAGGHPQLLVVDTLLARLALQRGDAEDARTRLVASAKRARREWRADHPRILEAGLWQATAMAATGDCVAAAREHAAIDARHRRAYPRGHPFLADAEAAYRQVAACAPAVAAVANNPAPG